VESVRLTGGELNQGVTILLDIKDDYDLPGNSRLKIQPSQFFGPPYLDIQSGDEWQRDDQGQRITRLPKDGSATIPGDYTTPDILPAEVKDQLRTLADMGKTINKFGDLADNINRLLGELVPAPAEGTGNGENTNGDGPDGQGQGKSPLAKSMDNLQKTLEGTAAFFGNTDNRQNFEKTLANLAEATASAKKLMADVQDVTEKLKSVADTAKSSAQAVGNTADRASEKIDELAESMLTQTEKLSQLLQTLHVAARKLENGEGTAGQMLNDPALYNNLVDAVKEINTMVKEMRGLIADWKEEGMGVKLR
ncbi:MAG: hypothetical protein ACOCZE_07955, partial [Planctomycetota bacterium]